MSQVITLEISFGEAHATTDIDPDSTRYHSTVSCNHATNGGTKTRMHIRHRSGMVKDER